ncbi:hypothetical protein GW17_00004260 [Ensete ventricosum]|nr:hypothetical protein GW17_00004260 [Ensete ventricosum]
MVAAVATADSNDDGGEQWQRREARQWRAVEKCRRCNCDSRIQPKAIIDRRIVIVVDVPLLSKRSVCGPLATGRFRQKLTVGGRFRPSAVDFGRRRSIEGEIDRRQSIEREKGKKKKRKRRKKRKEEKKKEYLAPASRPPPRAVAARGSPAPVAGTRIARYRAVPSKIDRRRSIEREIDRRRLIEGEKGKKKKRKRRKKEKRSTYFPAPSSSARRRLVPSLLAGRQRLCDVAARRSWALFLPCEEMERLPARGERSGDVGTADALAFFLPGVVSHFAKALYVSKNMIGGAAGSSVAIELAICGLTEFLIIVLDDKANLHSLEMPVNDIGSLSPMENESTQSVLEALRSLPLNVHVQSANMIGDSFNQAINADHKQKIVDNGNGNITLFVHRSKEWINETSANVDKLMSTVFPHVCIIILPIISDLPKPCVTPAYPPAKVSLPRDLLESLRLTKEKTGQKKQFPRDPQATAQANTS